MKFNLTRRDVLGLAGGTAVGAVLTPAPWKLIDDLAIWTQNWSWIPRPPRGQVSMRRTACALCPAGCAVEARCIANLPVSVHAAAPAAGLCALGLTGHHLPYHPARLARPLRAAGDRRVPTQIDSVVGAIAHGIGDGTFAVLDMRPGRVASSAWRSLASSVPNGVVIAAPGREGASVAALERISGGAVRFGLDLDNAKTIVSFGAPLAEGWGSTRNLARILSRDSRPTLIHVEPVRSRTAELADRWLPAKPGTEGVLALGIANVLIERNLVAVDSVLRAKDYDEYASIAAHYTPEVVESITGVRTESIVGVACEIASNKPAIVIAGEDAAGGSYRRVDQIAILSLNVLLGGIDARGGYVARTDPEVALLTELEQIPDRSIAVLIVDASSGDAAIPWPAIERKLKAARTVVALTPFLAGTALHASFVVPTAPFLEADFDVPNAFDAAAATLAISAGILPPRDGAQDPVAFARAIANAAGLTLPGEWATSGDLLRERVARIHASRRGSVVTATDQSTKPVADFESADALVDALKGGSMWIDDPAAGQPLTYALLDGLGAELRALASAKVAPLTLLPRATRDVVASAAVSPVLTKIYQESGLRAISGTATINPRTARELRLASGDSARLETARGAARVTIAVDEAVMPGVIDLAVGPDPVAIGDRRAMAQRRLIDICPADERGVWRASSARLAAIV